MNLLRVGVEKWSSLKISKNSNTMPNYDGAGKMFHGENLGKRKFVKNVENTLHGLDKVKR
jgi:hypothetical protein